jgi:hypothetical protein
MLNMSQLSDYQQWKDQLIGKHTVYAITTALFCWQQLKCEDCGKSITGIEITKYGQLPMYRYALFNGPRDLNIRWICDPCFPNLIQYLEQKRIQRYYTYLMFAKIHPDIAQYAIQYWNYSIPVVEY